LNPQLLKWQLGEQQIVRWKNKAGDALEGILIKPVGYQAGHRYSLIVDPYGDRVNDFKGTPMLANQMLAGKGYALFFPNHRGPQTFAPQSLKNAAYARPSWTSNPGVVEVEDILSGVDALIHQGVADPDRVGLYGVSNGASAINLLITASDRFKAAVSFGGVTDWFNYYMFRPSDDWTIPDFLDGKTPQNDLDLYLSISPLYHLRNVNTPLLLITGDKDTRAIQAVLLYDGLRRLGKPVELVRYPTEGHGISDANMEDYWTRVETFFSEHLGQISPTH
jgi:dipeptidyl aminopeptidase/acylaminoacyl peptidase